MGDRRRSVYEASRRIEYYPVSTGRNRIGDVVWGQRGWPNNSLAFGKLVFSSHLVQTPAGFQMMDLNQLGKIIWLNLWLGSLVIVLVAPWFPNWGSLIGLFVATIVCAIVEKRKSLWANP
jgi:hypothetical protein